MSTEQPSARKAADVAVPKSGRAWWFFCIAAIPLVLILSIPLVAFVCTLQKTKSFAVSGQVVDAETGVPIAGARVVITLINDAVFSTRQKSYGLVTDENGNFHLEGEEAWFVDFVAAEASTPADLYAGAFDIHGPVVLKPQPLPPRQEKYEYMRFQKFRGDLHSSLDEMEMIPPGWEVRTEHEIKNGHPPVPLGPLGPFERE
jgi:hypothetical protein